MGIPGTGFHAAQILDVLKSISGKLALKLINNPKDAREIIGLALTRLLLGTRWRTSGWCSHPSRSHIDLFADHKRQLQDVDIRIHRSDLLLARVRSGRLCLQLIEVKFRSGAGRPAEELALKEAIVVKNEDTQKVLETRFVPQGESDRLDREIQNKQLANLLQFYLDRCKRHGLIAPQIADGVAHPACHSAVIEGSFEVEFEKAGFIYNLQGASKQPEIYKENRIVVVGNETIRELLDIPPDVEAPPVEENPPSIRTVCSAGIDCAHSHKGGRQWSTQDTEEAEVIRVKAAEEDKEKQDDTMPAPAVPKPVSKTEEPVPPPDLVSRIPLGQELRHQEGCVLGSFHVGAQEIRQPARPHRRQERRRQDTERSRIHG